MNRERLPPPGDVGRWGDATQRGAAHRAASPYRDRPDGRVHGQVGCVPPPLRPAAPCAAPCWSAADEPALLTSFSNAVALPSDAASVDGGACSIRSGARVQLGMRTGDHDMMHGLACMRGCSLVVQRAERGSNFKNRV